MQALRDGKFRNDPLLLFTRPDAHASIFFNGVTAVYNAKDLNSRANTVEQEQLLCSKFCKCVHIFYATKGHTFACSVDV